MRWCAAYPELVGNGLIGNIEVVGADNDVAGRRPRTQDQETHLKTAATLVRGLGHVHRLVRAPVEQVDDLEVPQGKVIGALRDAYFVALSGGAHEDFDALRDTRRIFMTGGQTGATGRVT